MTMEIQEPDKIKENEFALLNLGFRVFFLAAGIFAAISVSYWSAIYLFKFSFNLTTINSFQWHSHEMVYGYSLAVISGFLLTAVKNWTGINTVSGKPLMLLFLLWCTARILFLLGSEYILAASIFDIAFTLTLLAAISYPVFKVKQWKQAPILLIVFLLLIFNSIFYLGVYNIVNNGINSGIYAGLYLVIGLILVMGRRVVPFFIERGVGYKVTLFNSKWLDILIVALYVSFFISELLGLSTVFIAYVTLALFVTNCIRLIGWYTKGIWNKSLLWSLYLALWFISLGFLFVFLNYSFGLSKYMAIHAFAYGGIGVITMGMMSRVALGHTGRDISKPSKWISLALALLVLGTVCRVLMPLFEIASYSLWVGISQILWVVAFSIFSLVYFPILTKPRVDSQLG